MAEILAVSPQSLWASIFYGARKVSDALPSFLACEPRILRDHAVLMVLDLGASGWSGR